MVPCQLVLCIWFFLHDFFYMHHFSSESWKNSWSTYSPIAAILHGYFQELSQAHDNNDHHANFDLYRDKFRNVLSANQPNAFPRHGHATVDIVENFQLRCRTWPCCDHMMDLYILWPVKSSGAFLFANHYHFWYASMPTESWESTEYSIYNSRLAKHHYGH